MKDADGMKTGFGARPASTSCDGRTQRPPPGGDRARLAYRHRRADAAQALLELGFATAPGTRQRRWRVSLRAAGAGKLREAVCQTGIKPVDVSELSGWGVSLAATGRREIGSRCGEHHGRDRWGSRAHQDRHRESAAIEDGFSGARVGARAAAAHDAAVQLPQGAERYCEPITPESLQAFRTIAARQGTPEPAGEKEEAPGQRPGIGE